MPVTPTFAEFLQADALFEAAADAAAATRWGELAIEQQSVSPLSLQAGATAEAARQLAFLGGPLALDAHVVTGLQRSLVGQLVNLTGNELGYDAGVQVFVVDVTEDRASGLSTLLVLRRL